MKNQLYLLLFGMIFLIGMISIGSADLGPVKQNQCANIRTLSNYSAVNLSTITVNGNDTRLINSPMSNIAGQTFNYSYCNTSIVGSYVYDWYPCSDLSCVNSFQVTPNGDLIDTSTSILYTIVFVICFGIFIGLLYFGIKTDGHNRRDETTGYVIALNNLKYFKLVCFGLSYIFGVFLSYFAWMMSYAYLNFDFVTNILKFVFYFLAIATLPLFILFLYITIANAVRDNKIGEQLTRGLEPNE